MERGWAIGNAIPRMVFVGVSLLLLCVIKPIARPENNEQ